VIKIAYIPNPKFHGTNILSGIAQKGRCPNGCEDCFFQSGRSYLEPLSENLPNMPSLEQSKGRIVRMNDGNDSNVNRKLVMEQAEQYDDYFYNTAINNDLAGFKSPIVLTVNPGELTDVEWQKVEMPIPTNLMFVRIRTNVWNLNNVVKPAVAYYTERGIPSVLTFMAYFEKKKHMGDSYIYRVRTTNPYYAITTHAWEQIMAMFKQNHYVFSCGKEGEKGVSGCMHCGNCVREYYNTKERLRMEIR
jgi:hypothetical protein